MKFVNLFAGMIIQLLGGVCLIYAVNEILALWNISAGVGINPLTIGVAAVLGIPGIIGLYGISAMLS